MQCHAHDLGLIDYLPAWELQNRLALEIARAERGPTLLLLEHPHTYTFGRRGQAENLLWDEQMRAQQGVAVHWVDRGGDVTYHGPGQLVGYPLLKLTGLDYVGYVRRLERMLILALARLGLAASQMTGKTGVWVQADISPRLPRGDNQEERQTPAKIAAIGVRVDAQGVTRHGFALNVDPQMEYFDGIIPCGLAGHAALALADVFTLVPSMNAVKREVLRAFGETFDYEMVEEFTKPAG
jgi:lipoate-protein ligase B